MSRRARMLTCHNLKLENDLAVIFSGISFTALPGSLVIVHGPNGSGKTSLLRMMTGIVKPQSGTISWNKINISEDIQGFNSNSTYIGHNNALKLELTVLQNLEFWNSLRGFKEMLPAAISYFSLDQLLTTEVGRLSAGWQRRVELTKLLLTDSSLWLLDEPEINLDGQAKELLLNLIKAKLQSRAVVVVASHSFRNLSFASYIDLQSYIGSEV